MSLVPRCVVCADKLPNVYSGGPCCGGVRCARFEMPRVLNEQSVPFEGLTESLPDPLLRKDAA